MKIEGREERIFGFKKFWYTLFLSRVVILNFGVMPLSFGSLNVNKIF